MQHHTALISGLSAPARALVTGASSGIGLAVTARLLEHPGVARVAAVARGAERSDALSALAQRHGARLLPLSADLTDEHALATLAARVAAQAGPLQLVFNAAGVLHASNVAPEKSLASVRSASLASVFALNAFAPILLIQALSSASLLRRDQPLVFASLSARVGSIGDNQLGGWYAYRASKAAQNQLLRTLAVEWRRTHPLAACLLLHPGTVDTPLSQPFQAHVPAGKLFTPDRAADQLLRLVAEVTPADSGRFIAWDGSDIPW
ncbi:MAG TPA: SDR family NAD(P)-dependent oxidoreductase [Pseudoxanthomonas sp.]|nr:SDR family NAD(P)-dependent oxidoreductase [Pseudoxanthomonas sp.]